MEIILMLSIMALIIWVAKLKTDLNIERMRVDTYRYYSLKLNHQIRGIK
jgi:hypothetical protein